MSAPLEEQTAHVPLSHDTSTLKRSNSQKSSSTKSSDKTSTAPYSFRLATGSDIEQSLRDEADPNYELSLQIPSTTTDQPDVGEEEKKEEENLDAPEKQQTLHAALNEVFPNLQPRLSTRDSRPDLSNNTPSNPTYLYQHSNTVSQPLTPLVGASPMGLDWGSNIPSSPKSGSLHSLRLSDVDSPVEGEDGIFEDSIRSSILDPEPPQFIMPSLAMPDRRPITDRGRAMGNLRICVAGAQGSGKTSLIRAIVQQCEDIVHIEASSAVSSPEASLKNLPRLPLQETVTGVTEILASTKCYPPWWNELDDSKIIRRRKSGDAVLERNLCFVDTLGVDFVQDASKSHIVQYIERSFRKVETLAALSDLERLNMVTGKGSPLVDVVIFVFSDGSNLEEEFKFFAELNSITNTIPVLAKSDLQDEDQVVSRKLELLERIQSLPKPFLFGRSALDLIDLIMEAKHKPSSADVDNSQQEDESSQHTQPIQPTQTSQPSFQHLSAAAVCPPFAVSSLQGSDPSEMDASLLMSESYSPPLHASDLPHLLSQMFDPENMSWLRHSAGRKYLSWRRRQGESKNKERALVQHSRKQSRQQNQCNISGFSFTPRFRGYATSSAKALMREATLGNNGNLAGMNLKDALNNVGQYDQTEEKSLNKQKMLESASELRKSTQSSAGASTIIARRQSQTSTRSHIVGGSDALELPKWSRPRKGHGSGRDQASKTRYREARRAQRSQRELCLKSMRAADPLGLVSAWEDWGRALVWGAGGGVLVGVAVAIGRWWIAAKSSTNE